MESRFIGRSRGGRIHIDTQSTGRFDPLLGKCFSFPQLAEVRGRNRPLYPHPMASVAAGSRVAISRVSSRLIRLLLAFTSLIYFLARPPRLRDVPDDYREAARLSIIFLIGQILAQEFPLESVARMPRQRRRGI
jgi:hypothetical protein